MEQVFQGAAIVQAAFLAFSPLASTLWSTPLAPCGFLLLQKPIRCWKVHGFSTHSPGIFRTGWMGDNYVILMLTIYNYTHIYLAVNSIEHCGLFSCI